MLLTNSGVEILAKMDILGTVLRVVLRQPRKLIEKGITTMLFAPKEKGQGLVEYAIILALVAIVVIAVMRLLGPKIGNTFSTISSSLP
jgi:pilus assembly protein Flp/PilA